MEPFIVPTNDWTKMNLPEDVRGRPLTIGTLVCYTTNARESGLQFGTVRKIKEQDGRYTYRDKDGNDYKPKEFRVQFDVTDVDGKPIYERRFDYDAEKGTGDWVTLEKQCISGMVLFEKSKFLVL